MKTLGQLVQGEYVATARDGAPYEIMRVAIITPIRDYYQITLTNLRRTIEHTYFGETVERDLSSEQFYTLFEISQSPRYVRFIKIPLTSQITDGFIVKRRLLSELEECWCRARGWDTCSTLSDDDAANMLPPEEHMNEMFSNCLNEIHEIYRNFLAANTRFAPINRPGVRIEESYLNGSLSERMPIVSDEYRQAIATALSQHVDWANTLPCSIGGTQSGEASEQEETQKELPDGGYWDEEQLDI